jgi:hypothetical protein
MKFKAQELLNSLNKEMSIENINELYKAIIAYCIGLDTIDEDKFNTIINFYYDNPVIYNFANQELIDFAETLYDEEM